VDKKYNKQIHKLYTGAKKELMGAKEKKELLSFESK